MMETGSKYIIHCLLKGDVEKYQHDLVKRIAGEFGLTLTRDENLDTHFTLKYWFETEHIEQIEKICEEFCSRHSRTPVRLGGFGTFFPSTIFINIKLSEEAEKVFSEFVSELRKIEWMPWDKFDAENLHFHSTIAEKCDEKIDEVWKFIQGEEKYFNCWFDNITILRLVDGKQEFGKWEVHKKFDMS